MIVLDAYAVIAYLRAEPCGAEVAELLREPTLLTAVNAAEICDQMSRVFGADPDTIEADLALLTLADMTIVPVTAEIGLEAGRIRARRYHRQHAAVSLADCVAAATSLLGRHILATADPALAEVTRAEGGSVYPLPDSKGQLP
ncbi:MAG TPA: PIN domain-containing protein [Streptosporangiaceae bacterium]|nr:PIN domain-containing protein [Streptosporangiaceae bacterium]